MMMGNGGKIAWTAVLSLALAVTTVMAQDGDGAAESADVGVWQRVQGMADGTWQNLFGSEPEGFPRVWEETLPRLEDTLTLEERHDALPDSAWFGADKASNRKAINDLLDESIGLLTHSPAQRYREEIRSLEEGIQGHRQSIARLRQQRVAAPDEALLTTTITDLDSQIRALQAQIRHDETVLTTVKDRFAAELQALGLEITPEQLDFLLSTVIGDDLIHMGIVFDNVREITQQLEGLMAEAGEDLDSARRYYGMYTVMLEVLARMHDQLIAAVRGRYLNEIDDIIQQTRSLMRQTRELQRQSPLDETLAANIDAQQLTLETANTYRDYLLEQAREVEMSRQQLATDLAIARNTYETVKVSGMLVDLMQNSRDLLDALIDRQVPALRTFQNLQMKREFEKLTSKLRSAEAS